MHVSHQYQANVYLLYTEEVMFYMLKIFSIHPGQLVHVGTSPIKLRCNHSAMIHNILHANFYPILSSQFMSHDDLEHSCIGLHSKMLKHYLLFYPLLNESLLLG